MAKLTYGQRKKMPKKSFAVVQTKKTKSGKKKTVKRFPVNDKAHARNALARLPQAKGLSTDEKKAVKNKANKKIYGTTSPAKIKKVKAMRAKRSRSLR
jgi:hypothetical protein